MAAIHYYAWDQSIRATWAALIAKREFCWIKDEVAVAKFVKLLNKFSAQHMLGRGI